MEQLFTPHVGLMVWTVAAFLVLVGVLAKFGWGPVLKGLDEREENLRKTRAAADEARRVAEDLRRDYDERLARADAQAKGLLTEAEARARAFKDDLVKAAQAENEKMIAAARAKLVEEERRLARELRAEMAELSLKSTEKMLRRELGKADQDRLVKEALADFETWTAGK
ncbi:MAG: F0F1 ATP synthase subunit B [Elusimicrobia bacterium]|jgi:F-type H+-transporting ATPase subunit b|nr:MAG: F0F1 ATP synthase subunit B [Elusimicrobiota bacterium]